MTKREFWLKLFSENDIALASAIRFCEKFATPESLKGGRSGSPKKRSELYEEVDPKLVEAVFPASREEKHGFWIEFWCPARGVRYGCSCCAVSQAEKKGTCPNCGATMDLPEQEQ